MSRLTLDSIEIQKWFRDKGDLIHNLNYELNENSVVVDLGGFTGVWAQQIINKYNSNIYIIEPLKMYYDSLTHKFQNNPKVNILNVGVATEEKQGSIFIDGDGSSTNTTSGIEEKVNFNTIDNILDIWNIPEVDLIQINIEGDEYPLMEYMIENNLLTRFKNIQVQFHLGIENDVERRDKIHKGLESAGFVNKFNYPFVWESWNRNN